MLKNKDEYRDFVTLNLTKITGDIEHIKESQIKAERHLELLNGRIRKNEVAISWIKGIGLTITFVVSSILTYFMKE